MMVTAVDTNVLVDVFQADPQYGPASLVALAKCLSEGKLVTSDVVWAELRAIIQSPELFTKLTTELGLEFLSLSIESAELAGLTWQEYRTAGGKRERVAADFLIGAHAKVQCDRLLTRDAGFCRKYFHGLELVIPITSLMEESAEPAQDK